MKAIWNNKDGTVKKRSKFGNSIVEHLGIVFHSKGEALRYSILLNLQEQGKISELSLQPKFPICVGPLKTRVCHYIADFQYLENSKVIVEDYKGKQTSIFRLKAKLFLALYPDLELRITGRKANRK